MAETSRIIIPAALAFWIACLGCAPAGAQYYVAPSGTDNGVCTEAQPCTPQGAVKLCFQPDGCRIDVADGDYPNPAIDIFYRRTVLMIGNCNNPAAVRLHATQPNAVLITVQDHDSSIARWGFISGKDSVTEPLTRLLGSSSGTPRIQPWGFPRPRPNLPLDATQSGGVLVCETSPPKPQQWRRLDRRAYPFMFGTFASTPGFTLCWLYFCKRKGR